MHSELFQTEVLYEIIPHSCVGTSSTEQLAATGRSAAGTEKLQTPEQSPVRDKPRRGHRGRSHAVPKDGGQLARPAKGLCS